MPSRFAAAILFLTALAQTALAQDAGPGSAPIQIQAPTITAPVITNQPGITLPGQQPAPGATQPTAPRPATPAATAADQAKQAQSEKPAAQTPETQKPQAPTEIGARNEFQFFVAESTGRLLPLYGYNLFQGAPSTFAPVDRIPVTPDYTIGPGDEIMIRAWGQIDVDYRATVDRNGAINIPKVGTLTVAGLRFQDLHGFLKTAIGRIFRNFELNVAMGELRSIHVFVVGHAARPGSYTVSSLSTLVNALFASGGPSTTGSMRRIELRRGNQRVTEIDLYDLIAFGDNSKDARLLPGDVIYIPPIGPLAAISGSVNTQAIFELKGEATLDDLLRLAGGLTTTAQGQKVIVERIVERKVRRVDEFTLDTAGRARKLQDGDVISVLSLVPRFDNAVRLQGNVAAPARYPWREGMRVTDLLVGENSLIPTAYWLRQNQGAMIPRYNKREVNFDYATVQRLIRPELTTRLIAFNLGKAIAGDERENLPLEPGDIVTIYAFEDEPPKTENEVSLQSSLIGGTKRRFPWREGMRLRDLIPDAQSLIDYYDYWLNVGGAAGRNEINWDYARIARLRPSDLTRTLIAIDLGRAILDKDPAHNVALRPGDEITIFSTSEIAVPLSRRGHYVRLEGEFRHSGIYRAEPGETLRQLVARAGGLAPDAYLFAAEFTRESVRAQQQRTYEETLNRIERELQAQIAERARSAVSPEDAESLKVAAAAQQTVIARLRGVKPTGRIAFDIPEDAKLADLPDLALEDGDRLFVPVRPAFVSVFGSVFAEGSFLYHPGSSISDYLALAGGPTIRADTSQIFVLRANGSVVGQHGWFSSARTARVMPGDTIVVPEDFERQTWTKTLKDWTQILYQFGLGAAALKVLGR